MFQAGKIFSTERERERPTNRKDGTTWVKGLIRDSIKKEKENIRPKSSYG